MKKRNIALSIIGGIFVISAIGSALSDETPVTTPVTTSVPTQVTTPKQPEEKPNTPKTISDGENGVLKEDVFVGVGEGKENYDEMFNYITKDNREALMQMVIDGKIVVAPKGTKITVIDRGFINAKIEIIESGIRGWVPVEYLSKE